MFLLALLALVAATTLAPGPTREQQASMRAMLSARALGLPIVAPAPALDPLLCSSGNRRCDTLVLLDLWLEVAE